MGILVMLSMDNLISQAKSFGNLRNISNVDFLSSGGTSTGADVAMWLCVSLEKIGFETAEARLAPGSPIQVYRDKATVQVYSNSTNS